MPMPFNKISSDTRCPALRGPSWHRPMTCAGKPVTMPGPNTDVAGNPKLVMLALCGDAYLLPPPSAWDELPAAKRPEACPGCESRADATVNPNPRLVSAGS